MVNLLNLSDLTFLLAVRLDSIERLENTLAVTEYITSCFDAPVIVLESASYKNGLLEKLTCENVRYVFHEDHDSIFYRTKFLNQMIRLVQTSYTTIWDTDVIAPGEQINQAMELLKNGEADFVYPYDKYFLMSFLSIFDQYPLIWLSRPNNLL